MIRRSKRNARKHKEFIQTITFFGITIMSIMGLLGYLWVYTEIDETLLAIELQKATMDELNNGIKELQNDIVLLEPEKIWGWYLHLRKQFLYTLSPGIWH